MLYKYWNGWIMNLLYGCMSSWAWAWALQMMYKVHILQTIENLEIAAWYDNICETCAALEMCNTIILSVMTLFFCGRGHWINMFEVAILSHFNLNCHRSKCGFLPQLRRQINSYWTKIFVTKRWWRLTQHDGFYSYKNNQSSRFTSTNTNVTKKKSGTEVFFFLLIIINAKLSRFSVRLQCVSVDIKCM